jgi:hypothetical protein
MTEHRSRAGWLRLLGVCLLLMSCAKSSSPSASRETNWLTLCDSDEQCRDSSCVCGLCTLQCSESPQCGSGARCQTSDSTLVRSACTPEQGVSGLCSPVCARDQDCPATQSCVQDACAPLLQLDAGMLRTDAAP